VRERERERERECMGACMYLTYILPEESFVFGK
jgi:hypothetical protein